MKFTLRNQAVFFLCFLLLFALAACSLDVKPEEGKNVKNENSTQSSVEEKPAENENSTQSSVKETTSVGQFDAPYTEKIYCTLSSGVKVDSYVNISDSVNLSALSYYNAHLAVHNFKNAQQILLENKQIVDELVEDSKESLTDSMYRYVATDDGFSLASTGENLYFAGNLSNKITSVFNLSEGGNSNLFLTGKSLDFASINDAHLHINKFLQKLNVVTAPYPTCYTIDYETLLSEGNKKNEYLQRVIGSAYTPLEFDLDDECYIFIYQLAPEGLPISTHMNGVYGDGSWTSGTYVQCIYSSKGLESLQINYQFEALSPKNQPKVGMTLEQALKRLDQKYNSIILEGNYSVDKIEFEYIPMPQHGNNSYILIPAWRFSVRHSLEIPDKGNSSLLTTYVSQNVSVFDAITGDELVRDPGSI